MLFILENIMVVKSVNGLNYLLSLNEAIRLEAILSCSHDDFYNNYHEDLTLSNQSAPVDNYLTQICNIF